MPKPKFNKSNDGIFRRTFMVKVRLTAGEIYEIQKIMMASEGTKSEKAIRSFLYSAVQAGLQDAFGTREEGEE